MGLKRTVEFRKDAVRIALTSGLTRQQQEYRAQLSILKRRRENA